MAEMVGMAETDKIEGVMVHKYKHIGTDMWDVAVVGGKRWPGD